MKELVQIWNRVTGRQYSSVNPPEKELTDLTNNRLKKIDIDTSAFEENLSECEGLNNKFNGDLKFNERKDEIINRLFTRRRSAQSKSKKSKRLSILFLFGFLSLCIGFMIRFLHPYDAIFRLKSVMSNGGEIFEMWRKPEVELYTKIYLFNITNAQEYMSGTDSKIKLQEVGPYVYRELLEHSQVQFNDNGTLSAVPRHPLVWQPELSESHREDDMLYLPHIALLSIANVVSQQSFVTQFGLNNLIDITNSKPITKMTAKEFMMGYQSQLMTLGNTFMPGWIYFDKLGLIDRMYDFDGDYETIFTGQSDVSVSGLIDTYRGSTDLPHWEGKHCSNVQYASDGTKFKSSVALNDSNLFYRKSLCRAAPLIPVEEGVKNGFKAYRYTFPEHMLDNGNVIEENKCFCRKGKCLPEGLIDVTDCYYGFPIALSYPHFYQGDEILFSKVEGLTPNEKEHKTAFWIQPESGLPLDVSSKFQINMALGDISMIRNTGRFSNLYLPMLWFDITMQTLPPSMEQRFKLYLNILPVVEKAGMYLSFICGTILVSVTTYLIISKYIFKSIKNKRHNLNFGTNIRIDKERNKHKQSIYSPSEIPLTDDTLERNTFRARSDRIKDLGHKISDKVHDSVGNVMERFDDFKKNNRKNSLINQDESQNETNDAYKSDSTDSENCNNYRAMRQTDGEDDRRYLEVLDDGSEFDDERFDKINDVHIRID